MRMRALCAIAAGAAIVAFVSLAGCSAERTSQEMQEQERNMTSENEAWQADVDRWKSEDATMRADVTNKAVGSDSSLAQHFVKLGEHEQNVANFEQSFLAHRGKVQEESTMPEKDRMTAHAALWADHSRLKIEHDVLASAHESLKGEHTQIAASPVKQP